MPRVSNEEFITRLTSLYESSSSSGSVYLTSKRLTHPGASQDAQGDTVMTTLSSAPSSSASPTYPLLFRASNGKDSTTTSKKITFSTVVLPSPSSSSSSSTQLAHFQSQLLQPTLRTQAATFLRKRDKAKERKVDKIIAARRKKDEELGGWKGVAKVGSKRGKGRRVRQRALKRAAKLRREEGVARSKVAAAGGGAPHEKGDVVMADSNTAAAAAAAAAPSSATTQVQNTSCNSAANSSGGNNKKKKKKGGKK